MGCRSRASGRTCGGSPTLRPRRSVRDRGVQLRNRSGARPSRSPRGVGHRPAVRRPRCQRRCAAREEWFCKGARGSGSVPAGAGGAKLSAAPAACPPVREAAQAWRGRNSIAAVRAHPRDDPALLRDRAGGADRAALGRAPSARSRHAAYALLPSRFREPLTPSRRSRPARTAGPGGPA